MILKPNTRSYIRVPMIDNKFNIKIGVFYDGEYIWFRDALIDTGCTHSLISANLINIYLSEDERLRDKERAIRQNPHSLGRGVESTEKQFKSINEMTMQEKLDCLNIKVYETFRDIRIGNILIGDKRLSVSYDYGGNTLIGMELLKDWDIHIGTSRLYGRIVLLACPLNNITDEYLEALEREFGIGTSVSSAICRNIM